MSSIFDGMTAMFVDVFGNGTVTIYPGGAPTGTDVKGLLRGVPVEGGDDLGGPPLRSLETTLKLRAADAVGLVEGDVVEHNSNTYTVASFIHGGSPADDGFVLFDLKN